MTTQHAKSCPICGSTQVEIQSGHKNYSTYVGDKAIEFPAADLEWEKCEACGEEFFDAYALKRIQIAQMKALKLLTPVELKAFRVGCKMTQAQMADLLQIGAKTYLRWERGQSIQTKALDNYIRLVMGTMKDVGKPKQKESAAVQPVKPGTALDRTRFPYVDNEASRVWSLSIQSTPIDQFAFEMLAHHGNS